MDTASPGSVFAHTRMFARLRTFLAPCLALLFSGLLLAAWLTVVSARDLEQASPSLNSITRLPTPRLIQT